MRTSKRLIRLVPWLIRALIPSNHIGSYTLYRSEPGSKNISPIYIGRADTDLQRRLCKHPYLGQATHFEFDIADSPEKAFIMECSLYHMMEEEKLENKVHPAVPKNSKLSCPFCNFAISRHAIGVRKIDKMNIRKVV